MWKLRLGTCESRCVPYAEPVRDGEVRLVDAVHVTGDRIWNDARTVMVTYVEKVMAFMLVGADEFSVQRNMIGEKRVGGRWCTRFRGW